MLLPVITRAPLRPCRRVNIKLTQSYTQLIGGTYFIPASRACDASGASFILSGGADGDIRLWGAREPPKGTKALPVGKGGGDGLGELGRYECKRRLSGYYRSATCVSYGRLELVSGHEDGEIRKKGMRYRFPRWFALHFPGRSRRGDIFSGSMRSFQGLDFQGRIAVAPVFAILTSEADIDGMHSMVWSFKANVLRLLVKCYYLKCVSHSNGGGKGVDYANSIFHCLSAQRFHVSLRV